MPYWEERGGRGFIGRPWGRGEGAFPLLPPWQHRSFHLGLTHLPPALQYLECAACAGVRNDWSECAMERQKFQWKKYEFVGNASPSFPTGPPPHHSPTICITVPSIVNVHGPGPPFVCACACAAKGCLLHSHPSMIMGTGQICIGHRALDGTAWGEGEGETCLGHSTSAYCVCWLHWHRLAYPSPPGMACSCSRGKHSFRGQNAKFALPISDP